MGLGSSVSLLGMLSSYSRSSAIVLFSRIVVVFFFRYDSIAVAIVSFLLSFIRLPLGEPSSSFAIGLLFLLKEKK